MSGETTNTHTVGLVGPTVDDEIRRAVARYGSETVKEATKRLTAKRRGRAKMPDWVKLEPLLEPDVLTWLNGGDPIQVRSNYVIAQTFAANHGGQSPTSTHSRILRKLQRKDARKVHYLWKAWDASRCAFPYSRHLEALEQLALINPAGPWEKFLAAGRAFVAEYSAKFGAPSTTATMREIQEGAIAPLSPLRTGLLAWKPPAALAS